MNGTDSKKHPYTCGPTNTTSVDMSLIIYNWYTQAYVACEIWFRRNPPGQTGAAPFPGSFSAPPLGNEVEPDPQLIVTLENLSFIQARGVRCYGVCYIEAFHLSFIRGGLSCDGVCSVYVSDSNFSNCNTALRLNGTVQFRSSHLNVTNTIFYSNSAAIDVSNAVPAMIYIAHSKFYHNGPQQVIKIVNNNTLNDKNMQIQIHDCVFQDNNLLARYFDEAHLIHIFSVSQSVGIVDFYRNNFALNKGGYVYVDGCLDSTFENLQMVKTTSNTLMVTHTVSCSKGITVQMRNCLINGTIIRSSNPAVTAIKVVANQVKMSMNNVTVQSNKDFVFYFFAKNGTLTINNSVFANNSVKYKNDLLIISKKSHDYGPPDLPGITQEGHIVVKVQNTRFFKNRGLTSILKLDHTSTTLVNVTFNDNIVEGRGGDIYISNNNSIFLLNNLFTRSTRHYYASAFVYSNVESHSYLSIKDSSFESKSTDLEVTILLDLRYGIYLSIDTASNITCPLDRYIYLDNKINMTQVQTLSGRRIEDTYKPSCRKCHFGFYNLQRVSAITDATGNMEQCLRCPYGGNCSQGIVARPNFWGYLKKKNPPTVAFNICPLEYCGPNPASKQISSYHSCYGNRGGFLCGQCNEGYTEAMFSTECRESKDCNDYWFWFFSAAYIICLSFLFIIRPCLLEFLWKHIVWFRNRNHDGNPLRFSASDGQSGNGKHFDHAVLKTIFYFYQIVELLLITTSSEDLINKFKFIHPLVSVFNFQIRSWNEKFGCPFPGLTAVTKQLFSSLTVFGTIACISTTCLIHKAMSYTGCIKGPRINLYLAAAVETLLLGYERLTDVSLSLLNCVPVNSEYRLFLDGNVHCWQWWQYPLISFIVVFVVPFIFVLYWGSRKLNQQSVSTKELTMACIMPLPLLCYWAVRYCFNKETRGWQEDTEEIKVVLQEPFRPPEEEEDEGTLYWESVLIGRRLVLLCLHSFIADPMLRLLCLDCACMAIFMHHLYKKPYRDTLANACESVSLFSLVIIATFSLAEASLVSEGIEVVGPTEKVFGVLQWIELVLLGVAPTCLGVLVSLAVLSQLVRLIFLVIMFFRRHLVRRNWRRSRSSAPYSLRRSLLYSLCM